VVAVAPTAVCVIRAWFEEGLAHETRVRARITESLDVTSRERTEKVLIGEKEILAAVANWLEAFAERS
jgi:hypothetical protein